jgi:hypothetical protein
VRERRLADVAIALHHLHEAEISVTFTYLSGFDERGPVPRLYGARVRLNVHGKQLVEVSGEGQQYGAMLHFIRELRAAVQRARGVRKAVA